MANPGPASTVTPVTQVLASNMALRLLAVYKGVNVNATGDTVLPIIASTSWTAAVVVLANASVSLSAAAAGIFTAPAAGGTAIVANAALSGLTGNAIVTKPTVASTNMFTATPNLYFNVATAQGAAATVDVYVYGYDLS